MNEVGTIISEVAGGEVLFVGDKAEAEGAKGVDVLEVGGVGHEEESLGYGVSEFWIDEIMMSMKEISLYKLFAFHEGGGGGLVVVVDFTGRLQKLAIVSTEEHIKYNSLKTIYLSLQNQ